MRKAGRYLMTLLFLTGCSSATKEKLYSIKKGTSAYDLKEQMGMPDDFLVSEKWGMSDAKAIYVVNNEKCYVHLIDKKVSDVSCRGEK